MFQNGSMSIDEAAVKLHNILKFKGVVNYQQIVFVAHSMGGLVVLRELISYPDLLNKVPLIVLYAVPQEGAEIARIGSLFLNNPGLSEMIPADSNGYLESLTIDWKNITRLPMHPHVICGYEKLPTHNIMVVPRTSASRFCDDNPVAIEGTNHETIVKPDRPDHGSMVIFVNGMNDYVLGEDLKSDLQTPDFFSEKDHFVYEISDSNAESTARLINPSIEAIHFTLGAVSPPTMHLFPNDTPKTIEPHETQKITMILGRNATDSEYHFKLQVDGMPDRIIYVRYADLSKARAQQAASAQNITKDLSRHFSDSSKLEKLASLPASDSTAKDEVIEVVRASISKDNPNLPPEAQYVAAADFLAFRNWPDLAAISLKHAETISPSTGSSQSTKYLAAVIAAESNYSSKSYSTGPGIDKGEIRREIAQSRIPDATSVIDVQTVASQFEKIPSLKEYGLSLKGDAFVAAGQTDQARDAYYDAIKLKSSPSLDFRLQSLPVNKTEALNH